MSSITDVIVCFSIVCLFIGQDFWLYKITCNYLFRFYFVLFMSLNESHKHVWNHLEMFAFTLVKCLDSNVPQTQLSPLSYIHTYTFFYISCFLLNIVDKFCYLFILPSLFCPLVVPYSIHPFCYIYIHIETVIIKHGTKI